MPKPRPIVLNQSRLKQWSNCNRLFGWENLERLTSPNPRSALEIGSAVHAALAAFHAGTPVEEAVKLATDQLVARGGPSTSFADKSVAESSQIAGDVLRGYFQHWAEEDQLWAPLNQEIEFLVEVQPGWWHRTFSGEVSDEEGKRLDAEWAANPSGIWLRGRSDNLSFLKGALYLVDYKTAARMDPRDLLKYEMDIQLSCYIYGLSKQLTEDSKKENRAPIKVQGAIIDLLVKTKVPQYTREAFTRSDSELTELEHELVEYGSRIRNAYDRVEAGENWKMVFPRNTDHCFRYSTCTFRDLCAADTEIRRMAYNQRSNDYVDDAEVKLLKAWKEEKA